MTNPLLYPRYWLLFGLPWPGGPDPAEAAVVFAPSIIPRGQLGHDAHDILAIADTYVDAIPGKVVFFSDLTLWLERHGDTWPNRGTDWEAGKDELLNLAIPAVWLALDRLSHLILCDATREGVTLHYPDHTEQITPTQRQALRTSIENGLAVGWPDYFRGRIITNEIQRTANG